MFDEVCSELRDVIHDAIDENMFGPSNLDTLLTQLDADSVCIQFIDDGLAITIGEQLYSISIQKI